MLWLCRPPLEQPLLPPRLAGHRGLCGSCASWPSCSYGRRAGCSFTFSSTTGSMAVYLHPGRVFDAIPVRWGALSPRSMRTPAALVGLWVLLGLLLGCLLYTSDAA